MISIDISVESDGWLAEDALRSIADRAVEASLRELGENGDSELSFLFTDDAAIQAMNAQWRGKDKPTNVLSFPAFPSSEAALPPMLGDIVLARQTVEREALEERKPFEHHLTHLIVHGFLHLMGFDHEGEEEAEEMEAMERQILSALAISDPYA